MKGGPVGDGERAEILDVLRGFALLGIWLAHVPGFSGWDALSDAERAALALPLDGPVQFLRDLFLRSKFYSLFSLLFGVGFALQYASARRRAADFASRFRRRQLGLLAIGVFHSAVWHGDILLTYALLGLALVPFADASPRRVLVWAVGAFCVRACWGVGTFLAADALGPIGASAVGDGAGAVDVQGGVAAVASGYHSASWAEMLAANARFLGLKWLLVLYEGRLFSIAGCFLLGVALGKWGLHARVGEHRAWLGRFAAVGLALTVPANAALAWLWSWVPVFPPTAAGVFANLLYAPAVPGLALSLAAALAWAWGSERARRVLRVFAAPGRLALSVYLLQTIVGIGCFYGVGLGWRGTWSLSQGFAFALAIFAAQVGLSALWLRGFRYGPVEWVWRCATYGRRLPLARG